MQLLQTGTLGFYSISPSNDGKKFLLQYWTGGAGVWTRTDSPEGVPPSLQPMVHFPDTGFLLATVFDSIGQTVSLIKDPGRASDADAQSANWCYESWEAAGYNGPAPLPASSHIESLHFTRDGSTLFGVSKEFTSNQDPVIIQKWPANGGIDRPEEFKMEGIDILRSPSKDTDARFIVMANSVQVEVWDVERQRKMTIPSEKDLTPVFTKVTRTPNKALMAVAYRGGIGYVQFHKIIVYEYEGNSERFVKTHGPITVSNSPLQASFSADGEYIAVYFDDGAQIFDLPNQKKITSEFLSRYLDVNANQKISGISFSPKNSYIAISYERTGPEAGSLIDVWDYANNRKLTSSRSGGLIVGRFSPDANYFVIRMGDYLLKIIGLRGPQAAPKTVRLNSEIEFLAFGPRAQSLAVVDGFSVNLIDLATGLTTALLHQNDITALAFSEDESYLATNGDADNGYSSEVRRWPLKPDLLIKEASDRLELFKRGNNR
jgi:WD40 repeat protein